MASMKIPHNVVDIDWVLILEQQKARKRLAGVMLRIALARAEVVGRIMAAVEDGMPPLEEVDE